MSDQSAARRAGRQGARGGRGQSRRGPPHRGRRKLHRRAGQRRAHRNPGLVGRVRGRLSSPIPNDVQDRPAEGQRRRRRHVRRGQHRHRLGDGAGRARRIGRRCRGGDHRDRRARRRHAAASRSARWSSRAPSAAPVPTTIIADQKLFDASRRAIGRPASGGALRARPADAVKRRGALLEGAGHPPQRAVEHLRRRALRTAAT